MKPKLLLLHGALGSKKQFEPIKKLLQDKFELYDLSFEGHGGIESKHDYSIALFAQNALAFMAQNEIEKTNIFGYSMGGYVALKMALEQPDKVEKIISLGTKFNWDKTSTAKEVRMLNPEKIMEKVPRFADKLAKEHAPLDWEIVMTQTAKMMIGLSEGERLEEADFKKINHEVIIGIGSLDNMVTYEESEAAAALLPNGRVLKVDDCPHPIDKIDAEKLATYIEGTFKQWNTFFDA